MQNTLETVLQRLIKVCPETCFYRPPLIFDELPPWECEGNKRKEQTNQAPTMRSRGVEMNTTIINGGLLQDKIDFLESENQALKAEVAELKEILAIEMERSYIRTELKTSRLLKQNKLERRKSKKIGKELEIAEQKLKQACSLAKKEIASKAGRAKQSPYEKAGTTAAVNKLLEEKKKMLDKRGGKAELTRLIIRKIENDEINAPDIPTEKTVMKWIANFQKQEANMLTS